jgi:hypothetical protein
MKRFTAIALLALATLLTAGVAMAADRGAQANVPFAFNVGDKVFPAGVYIVASPDTSLIELRSEDRTNSVMSIAYRDSNEPANGSGVLVFNRYGDRYFLAEVLCPTAAISLHLPTTKLERKARINEATLSTPTQVLVAVK